MRPILSGDAAHSHWIVRRLAQPSDDEHHIEESIGRRLCTNACACRAPELMHVRVLCILPRMSSASNSV
jgi:hypothetical protein